MYSLRCRSNLVNHRTFVGNERGVPIAIRFDILYFISDLLPLKRRWWKNIERFEFDWNLGIQNLPHSHDQKNAITFLFSVGSSIFSWSRAGLMKSVRETDQTIHHHSQLRRKNSVWRMPSLDHVLSNLLHSLISVPYTIPVVLWIHHTRSIISRYILVYWKENQGSNLSKSSYCKRLLTLHLMETVNVYLHYP